MGRPDRREILARVMLLLMSGSAIVLVSEIALRAVAPSANDYYAHRPYFHITFKPSADIMPGIEGKSRYIVNSEGIRGDELSSDHTYKILVFGGSTTECNYLDQSETWCCLLQKKLNGNSGRHKVWVGNVGKGGIDTRHHIIQMRYLLQQHKNIDAVMVLVGINDLARRLSEDSNYDPDFLKRPGCEEKLRLWAFSVLPVRFSFGGPYYKRTALWHLARKVKYRFFPPGEIQDVAGRYLIGWRKHRQNALAIRSTLPDLSSALEEYTRNLNTIIDLAGKRSVRLIMLTQPVMWRADLPEHLKNLLWFGGAGRYRPDSEREYYSVEALADCMERYNDALIETCRMRRIEFIDLASFLPRDTTAFYDDCHFNERGADMVAEAIAGYLLQRSPLEEGGSGNGKTRL